MNRPTPDPSKEGSRQSSTSCPFPSWEGLGVGSWSQCMAIANDRTDFLTEETRLHPIARQLSGPLSPLLPGQAGRAVLLYSARRARLAVLLQHSDRWEGLSYLEGSRAALEPLVRLCGYFSCTVLPGTTRATGVTLGTAAAVAGRTG